MLEPYYSLDALVRARLKKWPQRPPGLDGTGAGRDSWMRGRPTSDDMGNPFLKLPGSNRFRTLPDGLWLNFGGTPLEPYVDDILPLRPAAACKTYSTNVPDLLLARNPCWRSVPFNGCSHRRWPTIRFHGGRLPVCCARSRPTLSFRRCATSR